MLFWQGGRKQIFSKKIEENEKKLSKKTSFLWKCHTRRKYLCEKNLLLGSLRALGANFQELEAAFQAEGLSEKEVQELYAVLAGRAILTRTALISDKVFFNANIIFF